MDESCRGDERIGHLDSQTSSEQPGAVRNPTVDGDLLHACEEAANIRLLCTVAGQQLGAGYDGVRQTAATGSEPPRPRDVEDADVCVDEQLSRCGPTPSAAER